MAREMGRKSIASIKKIQNPEKISLFLDKNFNKSYKRELSKKEIAILEFIINYNLSTGRPIGSRAVSKSKSNQLRLSPSTIRNLIFNLENIGYLQKTASGRIPTKKCIEEYGKLTKNNICAINVEIIPIIEKIIVHLCSYPKNVYKLSPTKFEEIVARIFDEFGFNIEITSKTRDGGRDIIAHKKTSIGEVLYLIECKKYSKNRKVGVDRVRNLYGVSQLERATLGILITTSFFTKCAYDFQNKVKYQISLKDFTNFQQWIEMYAKKRLRSKNNRNDFFYNGLFD